MSKSLTIGLVAHDACKPVMVAWAKTHAAWLEGHVLFGTGTTGGLIRDALPQLNMTPLRSGPLGGDQQLGAMIAEGRMDALIFFVDPLSPVPHDVDVKALTRVATLMNIPLALNAATADLLASGLA
ncbi:MAG: methylglyoxal synthase [Caulobacteraceae bacterium]|nr:methylglyoxal synthase [Caulobacteraceae bacterium]